MIQHERVLIMYLSRLVEATKDLPPEREHERWKVVRAYEPNNPSRGVIVSTYTCTMTVYNYDPGNDADNREVEALIMGNDWSYWGCVDKKLRKDYEDKIRLEQESLEQQLEEILAGEESLQPANSPR
ncbi:hypothetical protein JXB11_03285 [Candidatus Woesearchaeota archaeon]|nr:hypothetical protein [Candidatus Woesearchaeota archaeon]